MSNVTPPIKLGLNHPKNYMGATIATVISEDNTARLLSEYDIVSDHSKARDGATELGYLTTDDGQYTLTETGQRLVAHAQSEYGSLESSLNSLGDLYRSPKRFINAKPHWTGFLQETLLSVSTIDRLIGGLQEILSNRENPSEQLSLPETFLAFYLHDRDFGTRLFLKKSTQDDFLPLNSGAIKTTADLPRELHSPDAYLSLTQFQLKSVLWHAGILTTKGKEPSRLSEGDDHFNWGVEPEFQPRLDPLRGEEHPDPNEQAHDLKPPQRIRTSTSRIIRNTEIVTEVKALYECSCQVCGDTRYRAPNSRYAEGHHIKPLGKPHGGPDAKSNLLILCPNCHADFDYGIVTVDPETYEICHPYDDKKDGRILNTNSNHELSIQYIDYHNKVIADHEFR